MWPLLSEKPRSTTRRTASGTVSVATEATAKAMSASGDAAPIGEGERDERLEGAERGLRATGRGCGGHEA